MNNFITIKGREAREGKQLKQKFHQSLRWTTQFQQDLKVALKKN